jgi:hypothetical protein
MNTRKATNVVTLPTDEERNRSRDRRAAAYGDLEPEINDLARMTDLTLHVYWEEFESGKPISKAGTPVLMLLKDVQQRVEQIRRDYYARY